MTLIITFCLPGFYRSLGQCFRFIGHNKIIIYSNCPAKTAAGRTRPDRGVEREQVSDRVRVVNIAVGAVKVRRKTNRLRLLRSIPGEVHIGATSPVLEGSLEVLHGPDPIILRKLQTVLDHRQYIALFFIYPAITLQPKQLDHLLLRKTAHNGDGESYYHPGP